MPLKNRGTPLTGVMQSVDNKINHHIHSCVINFKPNTIFNMSVGIQSGQLAHLVYHRVSPSLYSPIVEF